MISNCNWCLKPVGRICRIYTADLQLCTTYKMVLWTPKRCIRSADKLSFCFNIFPPYSSCCFSYFLLYENYLFLLSLKTEQWCMPTMHYACHNSVSLTWLQLPVLNSGLLYQAGLPNLKFSNCFLRIEELKTS